MPRLCDLDTDTYLLVFSLRLVEAVAPEPYNPYETSAYCAKFEEQGYLSRFNDGYILTAEGRALLLEYKDYDQR